MKQDKILLLEPPRAFRSKVPSVVPSAVQVPILYVKSVARCREVCRLCQQQGNVGNNMNRFAFHLFLVFQVGHAVHEYRHTRARTQRSFFVAWKTAQQRRIVCFVLVSSCPRSLSHRPWNTVPMTSRSSLVGGTIFRVRMSAIPKLCSAPLEAGLLIDTPASYCPNLVNFL